MYSTYLPKTSLESFWPTSYGQNHKNHKNQILLQTVQPNHISVQCKGSKGPKTRVHRDGHQVLQDTVRRGSEYVVHRVGSVVRVHMLVVVSVGRAAHHAVVKDVNADVRDRVIDDDARGNDLDAEEPLERYEAEVHQCIVDGFHKEFETSVDALVVVVVKEHMGIQIGDRT